MRVVFEFMLFEAGAFFGFFVAALLNAARAGQEITIKFEEEDNGAEREHSVGAENCTGTVSAAGRDNKNCDRYAIGVQQTQLECEVAMNTLLGQRIREQRKEKGWTIEQFAERVDLSANYVGDLERGVKIPKLETFIRIVEVLDVSADVLIRDSVPSASHVADDELSKKLSQLTPGQKKAAIDILNAYTDNIPYITK